VIRPSPECEAKAKAPGPLPHECFEAPSSAHEVMLYGL